MNTSTSSADENQQVSLQELIEATIRAVQRTVIPSDGSRGTVLQETPTLKFKNSEISALIPSFGGSEVEDIDNWFHRIEIVQHTYSVPDDILIVIVVGKLVGTAQKWYHSKASHACLPLAELKAELEGMFKTREDKIALMRRFEARRWRKTEKFSMYYHEKVLLGNKLNLDEEDLINYIIDAMDNPMLQTQARMQDFQSLAQFSRIMNKVTASDRGTNTVDKTSTHPVPKSTPLRRGSSSTPPPATSSDSAATRKPIRCFNCSEYGHLSIACPKPKRVKGNCFQCGEAGHRVENCRKKVAERGTSENIPDSTTMVLQTHPIVTSAVVAPTYTLPVSFEVIDEQEGTVSNHNLIALLDTGSPISLIRSKFMQGINLEQDNGHFTGINNSKLKVLGTFTTNIIINELIVLVKLYVVSDDTMSFNCVLGRDVICNSNLEFSFGTKVTIREISNKLVDCEPPVLEIMHIDCIGSNCNQNELVIGEEIDYESRSKLVDTFNCYYRDAQRPLTPSIKYDMKIALTRDLPFYFNPRRLSHVDKIEVQKIIDRLLQEKIIRPSSSEYCSPIVLVKKKTGETRMCVDYRELNKLVVKDRFPLPLIDDQLDALKGKTLFTSLDLRNGFHHIPVAKDSIRFTSFVTPLGQYEYLRMPFGICTAPQNFARYISLIFSDILRNGEIFIYFDDILIATENIERHFEILTVVFTRMVDNLLELRLDKCSFLKSSVVYLGYLIDGSGIRPNPRNVTAIVNFPTPRNSHEVHRFIGLASYFRRFIKDFATIGKPLYALIRKGIEFNWGIIELNSFELLKSKLSQFPLLSIYSPLLDTELHCDASSIGFGSVLLQRQKFDNHFHPVFYYSRRTSDTESRYHSYELETLAIKYSLERFRIYLLGIRFKIVTDCNSVKLALQKKEINPRINRWAMYFQNFDYVLEHRSSTTMQHVDALSRAQNVFVIAENTFESTLIVKQTKDPNILRIREQLESQESPMYELRDGIVYRKTKDRVLFFVPKDMQGNVIRTCHDNVGHVGIDKTVDLIRQTYWFPNLRELVKKHIENCLKCITFSPVEGKREGLLHSIDKGINPFDTIHIDHFGPLDVTRKRNRHIFLIIDAFSKFVKLFPCRLTDTRTAINHLRIYFAMYSKPRRIISDRGSCFRAVSFKDFLNIENVELVLVATACPRSNGQVERVNRFMGPMIAKLIDIESNIEWDDVLSDVEFSINNTICRSVGVSPSMLLFGINQKGKVHDKIKLFLNENEYLSTSCVDLNVIRARAQVANKELQNYNKLLYDKKHKCAKVYNVGDYVVIRNIDNTPRIGKKFIPKFKGPYVIKRVLDNDRYVLSDIEGFQITQVPFEGVFDSSRIRLWSVNIIGDDDSDVVEDDNSQDGRAVAM